jgi:hypothetical protein
MVDPRSRAAVEATEAYADGLLSQEEFDRAAREAYETPMDVLPDTDERLEALDERVSDTDPEECARRRAPNLWVARYYAAEAAYYPTAAVVEPVLRKTNEAVWYATTGDQRADDEAEKKVQARVLRCILGNPFRPVAIDPSWRTATVTALAQSAYQTRHLPSGLLDNARLVVLADAIKEAGCTDASVLGHLRTAAGSAEAEHVRGCHVIDLLLGKE